MPVKRKITCGDAATDRLIETTGAIYELREFLAGGASMYLSAVDDEGVIYTAVVLQDESRRMIVGRNFAFVILEAIGKLPSKVCPICPQNGPQPLSAFGVDLIHPDGIAKYCLACNRANYRRRKMGKPVRQKVGSAYR